MPCEVYRSLRAGASGTVLSVLQGFGALWVGACAWAWPVLCSGGHGLSGI